MHLLVEMGVPLGTSNKNKDIPLHLVAGKGHLGTVQMLVEELGAGSCVTIRRWNNETQGVH